MYILAAKFKGSDEVRYFAATTKTALHPIRRDAEDYRLWNDGWIDSKNADSWKTIGQSVVGQMARVVI